MPKVGQKSSPAKKRLTLTDLIDPKTLAEFMGWPFESSKRRSWNGYEETITAEETVADLWKRYLGQLNSRTAQTRSNFVRECAREALGVKGRTVEEVRRKCLELFPEIYSEKHA